MCEHDLGPLVTITHYTGKSMKRLGLIFALCCSVVIPEVAAAGEVTIEADHLYVPYGFDDNDHVEVVVSGWLPNSCYRRPTGRVVRRGSGIEVQMTASVNRAGACLEMIVPYMLTVSLGRVTAGEHRIVVRGQPHLTKMLKVQEANLTSIDDYTYADVDKVSLLPDTRTVALTGMNPSDCMALEHVRFISNGTDTYSVMPIVKQVRRVCNSVQSYFNYQVELPNDITGDRVLLHVRKLQGTSLNEVIDNPAVQKKP
jgi:hypothetical protein